MSPVKTVAERLKATFDKIHDGLEELEELLNANLTKTGMGTPAKPGTPKAPPARNTPLPESLVPGPPPLSDGTRAQSMKDGLPIATKIGKIHPPTHPLFLEALRGQLAYERIPFDDELIQDLATEVGK